MAAASLLPFACLSSASKEFSEEFPECSFLVLCSVYVIRSLRLLLILNCTSNRGLLLLLILLLWSLIVEQPHGPSVLCHIWCPSSWETLTASSVIDWEPNKLIQLIIIWPEITSLSLVATAANKVSGLVRIGIAHLTIWILTISFIGILEIQLMLLPEIKLHITG